MRSAVAETLVVGVGVAAAVIIIRSLLGDEPIYLQLLAVLGAGLVLGLLQFAIGRRRPRRWRQSPADRERRRPEAPPPQAPAAFDEHSHAWTGLSAPAALIADTPPIPKSLATRRVEAEPSEPPAREDAEPGAAPPEPPAREDAEPGAALPEPQPLENRVE
jgi:hypothetical protein